MKKRRKKRVVEKKTVVLFTLQPFWELINWSNLCSTLSIEIVHLQGRLNLRSFSLVSRTYPSGDVAGAAATG